VVSPWHRAAAPGWGRSVRDRVGAVVVAVALAVGCAPFVSGCADLGATRPEPPGVAEIALGGPDCLAEEVLAGLTFGPAPTSAADAGRGRHAPASGSVPRGFEPVRVVECRTGLVPLTLPSQELVPSSGVVPSEQSTPAPGESQQPSAPAPVSGSAQPVAPAPVSVLEVVREGELDALLAALSRPSDPVPFNQVCAAMLELPPQVYLVDALGRAVRPSWPVDACGFVQADARAALAHVPELRTSLRTLTPTT